MENIKLKTKRCCLQPMLLMGISKISNTVAVTRRQNVATDIDVAIYQCTKCGVGKLVEIVK